MKINIFKKKKNVEINREFILREQLKVLLEKYKTTIILEGIDVYSKGFKLRPIENEINEKLAELEEIEFRKELSTTMTLKYTNNNY